MISVTEALGIGLLSFDKQHLVVENPHSLTERKAQQMKQGKDMIGETSCIGIVVPDFQVAFVIQQANDNMG